jgi:hypothetical protein
MAFIVLSMHKEAQNPKTIHPKPQFRPMEELLATLWKVDDYPECLSY